MIHIQLIPFDKLSIVEDGKYLVRTESIPNLNVNYISARVWEAAGRMIVDVNGQTVTHISTEKLQ